MALALAAGVVPVSTARAEGKTAWIHVRVEEPRKESRVSLNVPLAVAEAALAFAPETVASGGRLHLGGHDRDLSLADLRRAWKELRAAGDAEIVSVEEKDQTVKIDRVGERVRIHVDGRAKAESVNIEVPTAAVDALLSGEGENLNLRGALQEIRQLRGDVVAGTGVVVVEVQERGPAGHHFVVPVPLVLAQAASGFVPEGKDRLDLGEARQYLPMVEEMVKGLGEAPDAELVRVEQPDQRVRVAKVGATLEIKVTQRAQEEDVAVTIPLSMARALVREARLTTLADVRHGEEHVRVTVW